MKQKLSRSLLFYDIIAFIFIFISVFVIFESVIKKIFISYGTDRFKNEIDILQFELSTGIASLEEKVKLDYKQFADECFNYLEKSYLYKARYDDSTIFFIFPDNTIKGGKKTDQNYQLLENDNYTIYKNLVSDTNDTLINFSINNIQYLGLIEISKTGIRKSLSRSDSELVYPIILIGNKTSDFFYLIDITRIFFIAWLFLILSIIAVFKIRLTAKAAFDIKTISGMLQDESTNIRTHGVIGEALKGVNSDFVEVNDLNVSSIDLNNALIDLKNVVKGVTNNEFFIGTITGNKSITEQHEINCTVMFLDIKGFTTISEKHKAKSMKIGIAIFSMVGEILKKYNGEIRKLLGDAALITFKDADKNKPISAVNAIKSAIEILESVDTLKNELNTEYNPSNVKQFEIDFNFRIGIDSGVVNEGLYGTPDNFEYGIIGDPVNTASRFEGLNKQYYTNILINENTYTMVNSLIAIHDNQKVKELFDYSFLILDEARTKGKEESGKIFTLYKSIGTNIQLSGWSQHLNHSVLESFLKSYNEFKNSILLWKKYKIDGDLQAFESIKTIWYRLIKEFAELDTRYSFHPAKQFLKLMLKFEDYELFEKNIQLFTGKTNFELKTPSDDWLQNKLLARELDK